MNSRVWHLFRIPVAIFLALVAALAVVYIVQLAHRPAGITSDQGETASDQQKLAILATLQSSSSETVDQKAKVLQQITPQASSTPSEEEKLKILGSLDTK